MTTQEKKLEIVCAALTGLMSNPNYVKDQTQRIGYDNIRFSSADAESLWGVAEEILKAEPEEKK